MISKKQAEKFCRDNIAKIENYDKAIADTTQTWDCHHRDEVKILPCGIEVRRSREELIENGRYYNCPANELIFLTKAEHSRLHGKGNQNTKGIHWSEEHRRKISESMKGKQNSKGCKLSEETRQKMSDARKGNTMSEFGAKFQAHYGKTETDDVNLYKREHNWYQRHNKTCRWE